MCNKPFLLLLLLLLLALSRQGKREGGGEKCSVGLELPVVMKHSLTGAEQWPQGF